MTTAETKQYDYIVIGGGSGGSGSARQAASYGAKTLIVESGRAGGTCVNAGCVPKKITWNFASINDTFNVARYYGYELPGSVNFDYGRFKHARDTIVEQLNGAYEQNWKNENIDFVRGRARFIEPNVIHVDVDPSQTRTFSAKHILIAVGGYPRQLKIPGAEYGITSDGFFEMEELPPKIAVVGAGYVAVELAGVMAAVGVETHMFIRGDTILAKFDPMIQKTMTETYEAMGVRVHKQYGSFNEIQLVRDGTGKNKLLKVIERDGHEHEFNELLWAVGRKPEIEDLDVDAAGVKLDSTQHVHVDEYQNTSADGVYAVGDVTGQARLTPVAIAAGHQLARRLFGPPEAKYAKFSYELIPTVVFAHPEVGTIGLTEPQARERYGSDVQVYHKRFVAMFYDLMPAHQKHNRPTEMKIICAGQVGTIVGLHILGRGISELLQGFGVAMKMGATKEDINSCVGIHPTSAEELVTM